MITYKDQYAKRLRREFQELQVKNQALAALMHDLAEFIEVKFKKDIVITMIFRTQQEQWDLYKKTDGAKTKRTSPHMRWDAVDIRDWVYTDAEKKAIGAFLKGNYDATNRMAPLGSGSRTYWLHAIKGQAMHFHIQYRGPLVYVFSEGEIIYGSAGHGTGR